MILIWDFNLLLNYIIHRAQCTGISLKNFNWKGQTGFRPTNGHINTDRNDDTCFIKWKTLVFFFYSALLLWNTLTSLHKLLFAFVLLSDVKSKQRHVISKVGNSIQKIREIVVCSALEYLYSSDMKLAVAPYVESITLRPNLLPQ